MCVQRQTTLPGSSASLLRAMDRWSGGGALSSEMYPTELEESARLGLAVDDDDDDMNRSYARDIDSAGKGQHRPFMLRGVGAAAASAAASRQDDGGPTVQVRLCLEHDGGHGSALLPFSRAQSVWSRALRWRLCREGTTILIVSV